MPTTADYLNNLVLQRNALADNLVEKGVPATHDETLDTLVPKVLDISSGGSTGITLDSHGWFTGDMVFPEGTISIPNNYFYGVGTAYAGAVTSITFPESLTSLGESAIRYIPTLQRVSFKGNNLKIVGRYCFMANSLLKTIIFPDGVETISAYAAAYINIEHIHLPASCITVDNYAFIDDRKLTNFTVGEGFNCNLNISSGSFEPVVINKIIQNYADNSGKTLTIGNANLSKLTDDEKNIASGKGLQLA